MPSHRSKNQFQNRVVPIDLRISYRDDTPVHSQFNYVLTESIVHNLRYALIWDSLRPELHDLDDEDDADEPNMEFMSFQKVKGIASNFAFLIKKGTQLIQLYDITSKQVPLTHESDSEADNESECGRLDKNTNLVTKNAQIILISRNDAKQRILQGRIEKLPKVTQSQDKSILPLDTSHAHFDDASDISSVSKIASDKNEVTIYNHNDINVQLINEKLVPMDAENEDPIENSQNNRCNLAEFDQIILNSGKSTQQNQVNQSSQQENKIDIGECKRQMKLSISSLQTTNKPNFQKKDHNSKYQNSNHSQNHQQILDSKTITKPSQKDEKLESILLKRAIQGSDLSTSQVSIKKSSAIQSYHKKSSIIQNGQVLITKENGVKQTMQRVTLGEQSTSASSSTNNRALIVRTEISNRESLMRVKGQQSLTITNSLQMNDEIQMKYKQQQTNMGNGLLSVRKSLSSCRQHDIQFKLSKPNKPSSGDQPPRSEKSQSTQNKAHLKNKRNVKVDQKKQVLDKDGDIIEQRMSQKKEKSILQKNQSCQNNAELNENMKTKKQKVDRSKDDSSQNSSISELIVNDTAQQDMQENSESRNFHDQNLKDLEIYQERSQFKQCEVKEYLDKFMPNRCGFKTFPTQQCLQNEILKPINEIHQKHCYTREHRDNYFIHFTEKYAQLKCRHRKNQNGKECLFRYWFKFEQDQEGDYINFQLFRLINSNHSLPIH